MPRSSGTYTLPAGNPVVTGTTITSTWANTTFSDVATALTNSVPTDGSAPMVGALQMGNNKITGVADGTASTDVATVNQISNPTITGGTIDGAPIGAANPKNGAFLALSATSASLTGTCTAPTVTPGTDSSTKIATTAFVQSAISAVSSGVTSFNGRSGVVTLSSGDVTTALGYTPYNSGGATVITTSNISSYAPTVNGTGAYGTWGISISGNAATASTASGLSSSPAISVSSVSSSGTITGSSLNVGSSSFGVTTNAGYTRLFCGGGSGYLDLDGSGNIIINGSIAQKASGTTWNNPSDVRLKTNITNYTDGLSKLLQVNPKTWVYNGLGNTTNGQKGLGVIADEIISVLPETVTTYSAKLNPSDVTNTDIKQFDATEITWLLVNAVKELNATIASQATEIAALKTKAGI
jgi:hypothetical protein